MESLETTSGEEIEESSYRHYEDEQRVEASTEHRQGYIRSLLEKLPESEPHSRDTPLSRGNDVSSD